jgi:hypothetical protein
MKSARFDFLTAVLLKIQVSWDVVLCCWVSNLLLAQSHSVTSQKTWITMKWRLWYGKGMFPLFAYFHTQQEAIRNGKCMTIGILCNTLVSTHPLDRRLKKTEHWGASWYTSSHVIRVVIWRRKRWAGPVVHRQLAEKLLVSEGCCCLSLSVCWSTKNSALCMGTNNQWSKDTSGVSCRSLGYRY